MLSVPEKVLHGESAADHCKFACKHFSLFGVVIAVQYAHGSHADVEVEFAMLVFLGRALLREVASGVFPT